jgi:hypothetical protein
MKASSRSASRREIRKAAKRGNAATPAERAAMTFPAINATFNWSNDDWALTFLPQVRVATIFLQRDDKELEKLMVDFVKQGIVPEVLEGWCKTKRHLEALIELINSASIRSYLVLERLGYSPDNPPPDHASSCH